MRLRIQPLQEECFSCECALRRLEIAQHVQGLIAAGQQRLLIASYGVRQLTHQVVHVAQVVMRGLLIARTSKEREGLLVTTLETTARPRLLSMMGLAGSTAAARRSTISA